MKKAVVCTQGGCTSIHVHPCNYTDRDGVSCATNWCDTHIRLFGDGKYCRRHASTMAAMKSLGMLPDSSPQLPPLGNRWASLLRWMTKELDGPIRELLDKYTAGEGLLVASGRISAGDTSQGTWTWRWSTVEGDSDSGFMVTLSGSETHEDRVVVSVNDGVVNDEIPPWVSHRLNGRIVDVKTDARERQDYVNRIVASIASALRGVRI